MQHGTKPKKKKAKPVDSPALQYLYDRYIGDDPEQQTVFAEHQANAEIARQIYDLHTKADLSQRELAKKVGTTASVICRLEDADYEGHSFSMLRRIAAALNKRIQIRFVPAQRKLETA